MPPEFQPEVTTTTNPQYATNPLESEAQNLAYGVTPDSPQQSTATASSYENTTGDPAATTYDTSYDTAATAPTQRQYIDTDTTAMPTGQATSVEADATAATMPPTTGYDATATPPVTGAETAVPMPTTTAGGETLTEEVPANQEQIPAAATEQSSSAKPANFIEALLVKQKEGTLFDALDTIRKPDDGNKISKDDLQAFLLAYAKQGDKVNEKSMLNSENAATVKHLMDNWDSDEVEDLRGHKSKSMASKLVNGAMLIAGLAAAGYAISRSNLKLSILGGTMIGKGLTGLVFRENNSTLDLARIENVEISEKAEAKV